MPVINIKWVGLRNPSTPNTSCQIKSLGPETIDNTDPIIRNLKDNKIGSCLICLYLYKTQAAISAAMDKSRIPPYIIVCDGVKKVSGFSNKWEVTSQLPPAICRIEPTEANPNNTKQ
jgi:hypothetical protein